MGASRFSDGQVMAILMRAQAGVSIPDLHYEHSMSSGLVYQRWSNHSGMDAAMMNRVNELGAKIARPMKAYAKERWTD